MAFPFLSEAGFEDGTLGHFDTEVDTGSRLDYPHYSALAGVPGMPAPWRGAYCMRVDLAASTSDAYVQETGAWDTTAGSTIYFRFMVWIDPNITMATTNEFALLQIWSGTNTVEGGVYVNYTTANGLRLGIGETSASSFLELTTGVWHCVEVKFVIDSGAPNDGTIDAWLDGGAFTQVGSLDQGVITSGVLGVVGQDAGTTAGVVLIDDVIADDARIYPPNIRFPESQMMTISGHAFVGPGCLRRADLLAGAATDNVLSVFDTDVADTTDASNSVLELKNTANSEYVPSQNTTDIPIRRGCYISLSGTNPRASVQIEPVAYFSDGAIRSYGAKRKPTPRGV